MSRDKKNRNRKDAVPPVDPANAPRTPEPAPAAITAPASRPDDVGPADSKPEKIQLKDNIEAYETARKSAHRMVLITCVMSLVLLGVARTPALAATKIELFGVSIEEGLPLVSYTVALGLFVIPVLIDWSYRALARSIGLRSALLSSTGAQLADGPERERLAPPLLGSPSIRQASRWARYEGVAILIAAAAIPLVCDAFLLADFSYKFSFGDRPIRVPRDLWFHFPGGVKPLAFDNVQSPFHPVLLPPWQPWLYLLLLLASCVLTASLYWRIFSCRADTVRSSLESIRNSPSAAEKTNRERQRANTMTRLGFSTAKSSTYGMSSPSGVPPWRN
jgi:hypothetical protein